MHTEARCTGNVCTIHQKFDIYTNKQNKRKNRVQTNKIKERTENIYASDLYGKVIKTQRVDTSEGAQKIYGGQHAGIVLLLAYVGDQSVYKK